ncbi:unnamed protein product, partial [Didymodactylos carnosus]
IIFSISIHFYNRYWQKSLSTQGSITSTNEKYKQLINQSDIEMSENVLILNKDKDLTLIWFDGHLDIEMKQRLEQFHEHIILCFSNDQLMTSITKIQKHKIILIVSGQHSYQTLQLLHDNDKINSFYIFCFNNQMYQDLFIDKKCSKLKGIYNEYDQLFNKLENQICSLLKYLSIFSLFDKNNKSIRNLEHESIDFKGAPIRGGR